MGLGALFRGWRFAPSEAPGQPPIAGCISIPLKLDASPPSASRLPLTRPASPPFALGNHQVFSLLALVLLSIATSLHSFNRELPFTLTTPSRFTRLPRYFNLHYCPVDRLLHQPDSRPPRNYHQLTHDHHEDLCRCPRPCGLCRSNADRERAEACLVHHARHCQGKWCVNRNSNQLSTYLPTHLLTTPFSLLCWQRAFLHPWRRLPAWWRI